MRNTRQRQVILGQLRTHIDHPGADVIYEEVRKILPRISLGTVYRNLELLSESGIILKLEYGSGQKKFDPNPNPHAHFRCISCGRIEDIPGMIDVPELDVSGGWTAERKILGANLEYWGFCTHCGID